MAINFFGSRFILSYKLSLYVLGGRVEFIRSRVLRKANGQVRSLYFLLKQILLIQKQYDRRVNEPFIVADRVKQTQALVHAISGLVLVKHLVVFAQSHAEDDRCDVLETVDPFFALGPLAAHVEQTKVEVLEREVDLHNTGCCHAGAQYVLLAGQKVA